MVSNLVRATATEEGLPPRAGAQGNHATLKPCQDKDKATNCLTFLSLFPNDCLLVELNQKLEGAQLPSRTFCGDSAPGHRAGLEGQRMDLWKGGYKQKITSIQLR